MRPFILILSTFLLANSPDDANPYVTKNGNTTLIYTGTDGNIKTAANSAISVLNDEKDLFYDGIKGKNFDYTIESGANIANWIQNTKLQLTIREYNGGKDTKTLAYVSSDYPNTIFINKSKADNRTPHSIANTIIHELVHSVDRKRDERFGHGGNRAGGKEDSAPYWIGDLAEGILNQTVNTKRVVDALDGKTNDQNAINNFRRSITREFIEEVENMDISNVIK